MKSKLNWSIIACCAALCLLCASNISLAQKTAALSRPLKFTDDKGALPYKFVRSAPGDLYLAKLRDQFGLNSVVAGKKNDYEKVRAVSRWVRSRWEHNGSNEPQKPDPISILEEAAQGKRFRCVEYSVVLAAALNALNVPARVVGLKTEDVETRESGAGHVVTEAYLASDAARWLTGQNVQAGGGVV